MYIQALATFCRMRNHWADRLHDYSPIVWFLQIRERVFLLNGCKPKQLTAMMMMVLIRMLPARLPVYWWLLLWAMAISLLSLYRQNLTSPFALFYDDGSATAAQPPAAADRYYPTSPLALFFDDGGTAAEPPPAADRFYYPAKLQHQDVDEATAKNKAEEKKKPLNIVLLYADDWSYTSLGVAGNAYVQTPRLDAMARNGIFFTHNCVVASVCMQSRATLYTGQYSFAHQTFFAYRNVTMYGAGRWNQTLYPLMKQAGYHVGVRGCQLE
jgi:Sulfatase